MPKYYGCLYCNVLKIDACSLIYLTKADLQGVAKQLYRDLRMTGRVYEEVVVAGKRRGHPDAYVVDANVEKKNLGVVQFKGELPSELAKMGRGEAETMMAAKSEKCTALLDDLRSKTYAAGSGIDHTSVDVLLIEALAKKRISQDEFEEYAGRLAGASGMRAERYAELLRIGKLIGGMKR